MKKIKILIPIIGLAMLLVTGVGGIASTTPVVKLDGKEINFDVQPYINENNRTMVPVRFISEAMNCKVDWEDSNQLVIITRGEKRILLTIGQNWAIVNDNKMDIKKEFDTKAVLKGDRTFVPLRFLSETLGAGVAWDEVNNTVIIRRDGTIEQVTTPTPKPTSWKNVEVPMTLVSSDEMPEGFIKPEFIIKHHMDGSSGYFDIGLKNIEEYRNTAADYTFKITCLNYDLINWTSGIPDMKRTDNVRYLADSFKRKYVNPYLWGAPSQDKKFTDHPEMGEVKIQPGTVLEMQVEFYYAGLKQIYRDSVELKQK